MESNNPFFADLLAGLDDLPDNPVIENEQDLHNNDTEGQSKDDLSMVKCGRGSLSGYIQSKKSLDSTAEVLVTLLSQVHFPNLRILCKQDNEYNVDISVPIHDRECNAELSGLITETVVWPEDRPTFQDWCTYQNVSDFLVEIYKDGHTLDDILYSQLKIFKEIVSCSTNVVVFSENYVDCVGPQTTVRIAEKFKGIFLLDVNTMTDQQKLLLAVLGGPLLAHCIDRDKFQLKRTSKADFDQIFAEDQSKGQSDVRRDDLALALIREWAMEQGEEIDCSVFLVYGALHKFENAAKFNIGLTRI